MFRGRQGSSGGRHNDLKRRHNFGGRQYDRRGRHGNFGGGATITQQGGTKTSEGGNNFRGRQYDFRGRQHDFGGRHSDFRGRHYKFRGCIMSYNLGVIIWVLERICRRLRRLQDARCRFSIWEKPRRGWHPPPPPTLAKVKYLNQVNCLIFPPKAHGKMKLFHCLSNQMIEHVPIHWYLHTP